MLLIAKPSGFLIGMAGGAAIWLLSPILAGRSEPWDGGFYYPVALLVAGLLGGWAAPAHMGRWLWGSFSGKGLYCWEASSPIPAAARSGRSASCFWGSTR